MRKNKAYFILTDTTSGSYTDEEREQIMLENEWRDEVIRQNLKAEIAAFLASSEYRNARGFRKIYYKFKYGVLLDKQGQVNLPEHEIEALARCFLPDILAFFESEEGKAEFKTWKIKRDESLKLNQSGKAQDEKKVG